MEKNYIDITPTWEQAINMHLVIIKHGTPEGKEMARDELLKIGRQMDTLHKERETFLSEIEENVEFATVNLLCLYKEACKRSGRKMEIDADRFIRIELERNGVSDNEIETFTDPYNGADLVPCKRCDGEGREMDIDPPDYEPCEECGGDGFHTIPRS
jgi:hypothetical protein